MKSVLMPQIAQLISSNALLTTRRKYHEFKRKLTSSPHKMHVFIHISDPYSYILIQALETFTQRFNITIELHSINYFDEAMFPEKEMWDKNAFNDACHLASLYDLSFPSSAPKMSKEDIASFTQQLLELELNSAPLIDFIKLFERFWHNRATTENIYTLDRKQLAVNETLLKSLGHYMSAMVYYAGEWYWGIDRLDHLEKRLIDLKLDNTGNPCVKYNKTYQQFCRQRPGPSIPVN